MLRVCLVGLAAGGHSGIPRYASALTNGLDRVAPEFPDLSLRLLTTPRGARNADPGHLGVDLVGPPFADANAGLRRIVAEQLHARSASGDLLHFFDLTGPLFTRRPFVATFHDAAVRRGLEPVRMAHKRLLLQPLAVRRASALVAVSAFAAEEAARLYHADPARIRVIHSGPGLIGSQSSRAPTDAPPYVLYVGSLEAHKNLPFLTRAFGAADVAARLVLVGGRGHRSGEVSDAVAASPARDRIEIRRDVSDAEVDELYQGAAMLVLPSRYEGFGFTALEAMTRGCPVLASDIPALREVSGDGALLLPVGDETAWSDAIRSVLSDRQLREDLARRGEQAVARYSWEQTAREVCRLFMRVGEGTA